jgi:hypothetical protein
LWEKAVFTIETWSGRPVNRVIFAPVGRKIGGFIRQAVNALAYPAPWW